MLQKYLFVVCDYAKVSCLLNSEPLLNSLSLNICMAVSLVILGCEMSSMRVAFPDLLMSTYPSPCISQGSPKRQKHREYMYITQELARVIMEADKSCNLLSARWTPRQAGGAGPVQVQRLKEQES